MKTLINSKVTKTIIRNYVFADNFKAADYNLTAEDMNYLYEVVASVDNDQATYNTIKKSNKEFFSEQDKTTYVNAVWSKIAD
jgi:deoxyhypusine synthase